MKNKILVTGSIAYDYLYSFPGLFQDSLDPTAAHISVAFDINEKKIFYGGCAANILYTGAQLGDGFIMLGVAGRDYTEYEDYLAKQNIGSRYVVRREDKYTSQAAIVTDKKGQQITFFYLGAAADSEPDEVAMGAHIDTLAAEAMLGIVAPNGKGFMRIAVEKFRQHAIPYIFDPGQATPIFSGDELRDYAASSLGMIMNEYEAGLVQKQSGMDFNALKKIAPFVVITLGEKGAHLFFDGKLYEIEGAKGVEVVDPTGCGDAFRAGLLHELSNTSSANIESLNAELLITACKKGTELAARCLSKVGTQNH
ncbi:hypothetical protein COV82_02955 [Candidatus Peregrinibacteria bacterium CG11_big_fil_rev_8_21_14_0_20_46_8]|nr:MAG: hypothetical protein COV82_02955 [Candidatus Peregrinibacteria bacterium CG11_big_fil_rev_8_21_14_0_20_46_8]